MVALICLTALSAIVFMLAFWRIGIVGVARSAIGTLTGAVAVLKDPALDDLAREKAAQKAGLSLIRSAASILIRSLFVLLLAGLPILAADLLGMVSSSEAIAFLARWDVIAVVSIIMLAVWLVGGRLWQGR